MPPGALFRRDIRDRSRQTSNRPAREQVMPQMRNPGQHYIFCGHHPFESKLVRPPLTRPTRRMTIKIMRILRHIALTLTLILALVFPLAAQADEGEEIEPTAQRLFLIERNKNANIVVYDAQVLPDSNLAEEDPVIVYWLKLAEGGHRKDLKRIDKKQAGVILDRIEKELPAKADACPELKGSFAGFRKFRIGDFRIIFCVMGDTVLVTRIRNRKDVYRL